MDSHNNKTCSHNHGSEHGYSHGHSHSSCGHAHNTHGKALLIVLSITSLMMVAEFVGGILSGSIALVSDALHMLTDTMALALAFAVAKIAERKSNEYKTYGYRRSEIVSAFINGSALLVMSGFIIAKAIERIMSPSEIETGLMLGVAFAGLIVNIIGVSVLHGKHEDNLNIKGAMRRYAGLCRRNFGRGYN